MHQRKERVLWFSVFCIVFLFSVMRCFFGIDIDEEYTLTVSAQIADGYKMFRDVWASHQTSSFMLSPFIFLWKQFFGNTAVVLAARIFSVTAVFVMGIVLQNILKEIVSEKSSYFLSIAFFLLLPRGIISLEYGLLQMCFVTFSVTMILLYLKKTRILYLIFSAVFWSLAVLCYPYLAFITPFLIAIIPISGKGKWKEMLWFILVCALCAILFLCFIMTSISFPVFLDSVRNILTDASHSPGHMQSRNYFSQVPDIIKKLLILTFVSLPYAVFSCIYFKRRKNTVPVKQILIQCPFFAYTAVMIAGNMTGIYRMGSMGVAVGFAFFSIAAFTLSVMCRSKIQIWVCVTGFLVYMVSFLQGDLGPKDYFNFLYLPTFLSIYQLSEAASEKKMIKSDINTFFLLASFFACLLFTKAFCPKEEGIQYTTVFDQRLQVSAGPMKGVWQLPDLCREREEKHYFLADHTSDDRIYLVADANTLHNLDVNGKYIFVSYLGSLSGIRNLSSDPRWIAYFDQPYHERPNAVFVDREDESCNYDDFIQTQFGRFLLSINSHPSVTETEHYYVIDLDSSASEFR